MRLIPAALVLAFTIYCVLDVVRSEASQVRGLSKTFWVVVVLVAPVAGGVAWLLAGRPRAALPGRAPGRARPPVLGPDDDPDFLRTIDRPRPVPPAEPLDGRPGDPAAGPVPGTPEPPGTPGTPGTPDRSDEDPGSGTAAGTDDRRP